MFTRQHYKAIAQILHDQYFKGTAASEFEKTANALITVIAINLSEYFAEDNPNFDADSFLKACGVK